VSTLSFAPALALTLSRAQSQPMRSYFDHEKLKVYQSAIRFITWSTDLLIHVEARAAVKDQLDRASTSVPLNIAEGNGKFAIRDRCRFLDFARSSALECAACLDVLIAKKLLEEKAVRAGKEQLLEIVSMLVGLINSLSARIQEDAPSYLGSEQEHE
jgi:four helix bundle protein